MSLIAVLYELLSLVHLVGAGLIGGGLIGVGLSDLKSRQIDDLPQFSAAIHDITVIYKWIVVPGAILLLVSGASLIGLFYGGWVFLRVPWLAGMVFLFAITLVEGSIITRGYFMKLRRITGRALKAGHITPELTAARRAHIPTVMHFLHLPLFLVVVALGLVRPATWTLFVSGTVVSLLLSVALSVAVHQMYTRRSRAAKCS